ASDLTEEECMQWIKTMRPYRQLSRPLLGHYPALRGKKGEQTERELAAAFYPIGGFAFQRSHALQCAAPLGSIFKLLVGYEALQQKGPLAADFTIVDEVRIDRTRRTCSVGFTPDRKAIP